jgi:alpha-tubulin suppressor-like RCC1 family protein
MEHDPQKPINSGMLVMEIGFGIFGPLGIYFGLCGEIQNRTIRIILLIFSSILLLIGVIALLRKKVSSMLLAFIVLVLALILLLFAFSKEFPKNEFWIQSCVPTATPTVSPPPTIAPTPTPNRHDPLTPEQAEGKIAAGYDFTILLRNDGTVASFGGKAIDTSGWRDIIQVAGYGDHALGLCKNGAVVSTGLNKSGECDVSDWENVKQISASYQGSIAVTKDGRVLYTGFDKNGQSSCMSWTDMNKILGGEDHILGLKNNGTVVASGYNGDERKDVSSYKNVIAGDAANGTTFVVMSDAEGGTIVKKTGKDWKNEDSVTGWTGIIDISGGDEHTIGLRSDGTVAYTGANDKGQCNVTNWKGVVAICAGQYHSVGLLEDGSLVATGQNHSGECDVSGMNYWVD